MFEYNGSGVMPGRTWVIAPDAGSLLTRWKELTGEKDAARKQLLFHPHIRGGEPGDKHIRKTVARALTGHPAPTGMILNEAGAMTPAARYSFRTLDRQWIIPDARLINQPNPTLWDWHSNKQVYLTAFEAHSPSSGPALSCCGLIPDLHHYKGSFGGRVFPLWRDAAAKIPNVKAELIAHLSAAYGFPVSSEDVMAYIAAVLSHPAFTARFQADLVRPGLRLPITADASLFSEAAKLGREVVWLHCYGERFADPKAGRPAGPPRLPKGESPVIPAGGGIPGAPEPLPDTMDYDPSARRLSIDKGRIDNVPQAVWDYEVSGKNVLRQWFSYRKRDRSRPIIGDRRPPSPLDKIQPDHWLDEYTSDLMNLLHVLGRLVKLEPAQAGLLERICAAPLLPAAFPEAEAEADDPAC